MMGCLWCRLLLEAAAAGTGLALGCERGPVQCPDRQGARSYARHRCRGCQNAPERRARCGGWLGGVVTARRESFSIQVDLKDGAITCTELEKTTFRGAKQAAHQIPQLAWTHFFNPCKCTSVERTSPRCLQASLFATPFATLLRHCRLGRPYAAFVAQPTDLITNAADGGAATSAARNRPHSSRLGFLAVECPPASAEYTVRKRRSGLATSSSWATSGGSTPAATRARAHTAAPARRAR